MQDEIEIRCPKCHSSYIKVNLEQNNQLRLSFYCQLCGHSFFASNNLKMREMGLKTENVTININLDKNLDAKIIQLYKNHEKLGAISLYNEQRNVSIEEAKEYVENLNKYITVEPVPKSEAQIFDEQLIELVRNGERYKAIKFFQEKHGCSRRDAKDYINHIVEFRSDIEKPGCLFWFILLVLLSLIIRFIQWIFG